MTNVVSIAGKALEGDPAIPMPAHFRAKRLKAAWTDLVTSAPADRLVPSNRFLLEMAATLLAKFRSGRPMTATESKELKRHLTVLGLAGEDDDGASGKKKPKSKYFD